MGPGEAAKQDGCRKPEQAEEQAAEDRADHVHQQIADEPRAAAPACAQGVQRGIVYQLYCCGK